MDGALSAASVDTTAPGREPPPIAGPAHAGDRTGWPRTLATLFPPAEVEYITRGAPT
jgi:hypothetical protein